jgi:4-aminobutyrate aminotransferase
MLTFAKGLGNGLSIAGVVASGALMDSVQANSISTFGGTPLVTAGALANLRYSLAHDLQGNALTVGRRLMDQLAPLADKFGVVGEVRGKGLMIGIELVAADGRTPNADAATRAIEHAREAGLLIGKGGLYGNCIRLAPPLSLTLEEADQGGSILADVLATVDREEGGS